MYELRSYASPKSKLTQMIKKGEIIQLVRTVYADSLSDPKLAAASMIYIHCYISFETALAYHQMIPERMIEVKIAVFIRYGRLQAGKIYKSCCSMIFDWKKKPSCNWIGMSSNPWCHCTTVQR